MRDKRVRVWDKVTQTYLYSDKFPSMWQFYKELENRGIRHFETEDHTGLKDKNGKEIYEGDIVLTDEAGWKAKVEYHRGAFLLVDNTDWGYSYMPNWELCEVIGNIYENELGMPDVK